MKNFLLLAVLSIASLTYAQNDDYCTCMDPVPNTTMLDQFSTLINQEINTLSSPSNSSYQAEFVSNETMIYINTKPQDRIEKEKTKEEPKEEEPEIIPAKEKLDNQVQVKKTKTKYSKKLKRVYLKKKKRPKKYKGKCPYF